MDVTLKTTAGYGFNPGTAGSSPLSSQDSRLDSTCKDMESLFIQNMLKEMRASVPQNGLFSGGKAEEMFTSMLDAEMAKKMSAAGGIGLSSIIQKQLENTNTDT